MKLPKREQTTTKKRIKGMPRYYFNSQKRTGIGIKRLQGVKKNRAVRGMPKPKL